MNCRDFIIEFEDRRGDLTDAATLHVKVCRDCEKTSRDQTQVWLMIDELPRIDAPNDFDFRVKARIAQGKPAADFQPRLFPVLRYVLPLGLAVLVLGIFAFNTSFFFGGDAPQVADNNLPTPNVAESPAMNYSMPEQTSVAVNPLPETALNANIADENLNVRPSANEQQPSFVAASETARKTPKQPRREKSENSNGGSLVSAVTSPGVIVPEEFSTNKSVAPLNATGQTSTITDAQVLEFIGVETVSEKGGKRVKTVKPQSLAERSGVKTGDVVEAIDGRRIGGEPLRMETAEIKN